MLVACDLSVTVSLSLVVTAGEFTGVSARMVAEPDVRPSPLRSGAA